MKEHGKNNLKSRKNMVKLKSWKFKVHEVFIFLSQNLCNDIPCMCSSFCYRLRFYFLKQELIALNETQPRQYIL